MVDYISLHNHTSMSIMDSVISKPIDLLQRAKELGQSAIAITEHGSCVSLWDGLKASKKTGVKLIAGCEMYFVDDVANQTDTRLRHIILIAKNQEGYKNLLTLNKKGYDNYIVAFKKAVPRIDWKLLEEHKEGLICTTACGNGIISQLIMADKLDAAREQTLKLKEIFGDDLALELQPHHLQRRANAYSGPVDQRKINLALKKLGEELNIRCIVASDTHYLAKEHHKANEVLLAIGCGQPVNSGQRLTYDKPDMYLKSGDEVLQYFERHRPMWGDQFIDSLFANTIYLADKCEAPDWIDPKYTNPTGKELPQFPVKDQPDYQEFLQWSQAKNTGLDEDVMYLRYWCERELDRRFKSGELTSGTFEDYQARVLEELEVLEFHGFSSYMLIVADFLNFARKNGIACGPGRGSVGGSYVAQLLEIHKSDSLKYGLIFARFHNREKKAEPDVDSDIAPSGREKVQEYIRQKYGEEFVAHVSNVNTITPKVYARDISRAFEFGDEGRSGAAKIGDAIADSIPAEMKTATQALEDAPLFAEYAKQYPQLKECAELVGGKARGWSTHAAGIVIGKRKLTGLFPLRRDIYGQLCTEYEKEKVELTGLVKLDLLGLETLDIISDTYRLIKENGKISPLEPFDYDAYDEKAYQLISDGNTFCVFQLGGTATHLCKAIKPKCIEDISLINALVRPSAKAIVNDFINVRDGKSPTHLLHPLLERAFAGTYGFPVYEECLMAISHDVCKWDLNKCDRMRKMTKEKGRYPERVAELRKEFISDAQSENGLSEELATKIWELVESFGSYAFNKSHSILYSYTSYRTAYLKAHFPLEFLVSNLMSEVRSNAKQAKENIIRIKDEIRALGVKIVPPDVNTSELAYKIVDDKTLMTGLDSLKYMGADAIPELIGKRPFHSFSDLISRVDASKVRAPSIQAMAASGSLDSFGLDRKMMFLYASDYRNKLRAHMNKMRRAWDKKNQLAPPDSETAKWITSFEYPWPSGLKPWSARELYALEEFYMGEGISGTIKERYEGFFDEYSINFNKLKELMPYEKQSEDEREDRRANTHNIQMQHLRGLKGIITTLFSFRVKKEDSKIFGQEMARIVVQDAFGNDMDVIAFPDAWECAQHRIEKELARGKHKVEPGIAIFFSGSFQWENAHTNSFILGDILDYRPIPALPTDLKSRKVKMPRGSKLSKKDIDELEKEDVVEQLEEEMIDEGLSPIGDEDEFDDEADQ